ncbi:galactoside alpha-(1,2)-fucosyltransferase 1-like [Mytilus trossulus]|uniref:galactoside alpha-(1,2)-fucosyltransferase 1-like n=1 Tax=Mytilus trossulus TaxID=6551 RepID=UPI003007D00E
MNILKNGYGWCSRCIVVFIVTAIVLIIFEYNLYYITQENVSSENQIHMLMPKPKQFKIKHKICPMFECGTCGIGNAIFQFASAFGIALHHNMTLVITENEPFNKIFDINDKNIQKHRNRDICDRMPIITENFGCCAYDSKFRNLNSSRDYRLGHYLHSWKYFHGYEEKLRKVLVFKRHLLTYSENVIKNLLLKHGFRSKSDAITVGIHVRRGDMVQKFQRGYNVASKNYFTNAVRYMSSKFNKTILFIIASNDKEWTSKNIISNKDLKDYKFELLTNNKPEVDFTIISNSDHVITSVGTFGWWMGWLANGLTLYYKWPTRPNTFVGSQYNKNFTDFFYTDWIGIS